MEGHGQADGVNKDHVVPEWKREEGFTRREGVHSVEHFDNDKAFKFMDVSECIVRGESLKGLTSRGTSLRRIWSCRLRTSRSRFRGIGTSIGGSGTEGLAGVHGCRPQGDLDIPIART